MSLEADFGVGVIGGVLGLEQVLLAEGVDVDNGHTIALQETGVLLECGGVHRHEHVTLVAGGVNPVADVYLETTDAAQCPLRGTHLGRIVGKGADLVANAGAHVGENVASQLHTIAAVATEAHHDAMPELDFVLFHHCVKQIIKLCTFRVNFVAMCK